RVGSGTAAPLGRRCGGFTPKSCRGAHCPACPLRAIGIFACAVFGAGSAESLAISLFTKLRNSELNGAPRCESLFIMYSIFGPTSFCDPIPPKVIHGFGL